MPDRIEHPELLPGLDAHSIRLFWALVDIKGPNECWLWKGHRDRSGYGKWTTSYKIHKRKRKGWLSHVLAYTITFGPPKHQVNHNCPGGDQRACCNPDHHWDGTQAENMADAARKGTISQGTNHFTKVHQDWVKRGDQKPFTKIPDAKVPEIFELKRNGCNAKDIAKQFNVQPGAIWRILSGQRRPTLHPDFKGQSQPEPD